MSYDIYLRGERCPTCGNASPAPCLPDPTYNLTPIFDAALTAGAPFPDPELPEFSVVLFHKETSRPRGLRLLNDRVAAETVPDLERALAYLLDPANAATLKALEPPNGWGNLAGAISVMRQLLGAARECPTHRWKVR